MPRRTLLVPVLLAGVTACDERPTATAPVPEAKRDVAPAVASVTVLMTGLENPRQLAFGPDGALYVAEAGGTTFDPRRCIPGSPQGESCWSGTGAVSRWRDGQQQRVLASLPSVYNPVTRDVSGPHDVGFGRGSDGFVSIGLGANPTLRAGLGDGSASLGTIQRFDAAGTLRLVADVAAIEIARGDPDGAGLDANPYGILVEAERVFATDAGGNFLAAIGAVRSELLAAVFPPIANPPGTVPPVPFSQPVPTEVVRGPDGALYVSRLGGFPFAPGGAAILRVVPGTAPTVFRGDFTAITDFDVARDGTLFVLQYASAFVPPPGNPPANPPGFTPSTGSIVRVAPDGTRTVVFTGLDRPAGIVIGPDGALYVSNRGVTPGAGEVLRIVP